MPAEPSHSRTPPRPTRIFGLGLVEFFSIVGALAAYLLSLVLLISNDCTFHQLLNHYLAYLVLSICSIGVLLAFKVWYKNDRTSRVYLTVMLMYGVSIGFMITALILGIGNAMCRSSPPQSQPLMSNETVPEPTPRGESRAAINWSTWALSLVGVLLQIFVHYCW